MAHPENKNHVSYCLIVLDGSPAPVEFQDALLECTVQNSLHLPDTCALRIKDPDFQWIDSPRVQEAMPLRIEAGTEQSRLAPVFDGEVTAIEMDLAAHGIPTITIIALDRTHRLQRGRHQRSFVQTKDSDIVQKIGGENGFRVHAEATADVHEWIFQNNQTNWEFLTERAARNGFRLYVSGRNDLHFEKVKDGATDEITVRWGEDLRSFRPRVSTAGQVQKVVVRGWDPKRKQAIIGTCSRASGLPDTTRKDGAKAAAPFGDATMVVVDRPVHSQREAEDIARSLFDEIAGQYLEAEGLCYSLPRMRPGSAVHIPNIGKRFSGSYFVTGVTHTYTPAEGFTTQFAATGKQPATLLSLLNETDRLSRARLGGNIVIGVVTDNKDPDGLGRVKVKYPWITEEHTSFWARTASQMAGGGRGMFNLPEIDDEVLVAFEHGDIHRPYVLGQLWNGKDLPPAISGDAIHGPGSETNRRGFYSRIGHQMNFNDTGGKGDITFKTAGGHTVSFNDAAKNVAITTTGGHNVVADDAKKQVEIKTTSGHTITMSDVGNNISIVDNAGDRIDMTMGAVSIVGLLAVSISAPLITMNAGVMLTGQAPVTNFMAGMRARMTSTGTLTLDATDDMNVTTKAGLNVTATKDIKAEATGDMDLKGKALKLNS